MIKKYYNTFMHQFYRLIPSHEINIKELFTKVPCKGYQMVVALRYLFIEATQEGDSEKLSLYNRAIHTDYRQSTDNRQFRDLINSIQHTGFRQNSAILIDQQNNVIDGTHRLAVSIYLGKKTIIARRIPRKMKPLSLSKRIALFQLSQIDLEVLYETYRRMMAKIESA